MPPNARRVVYIENLMSESYAALFQGVADITLTRIANQAPAATWQPILAQAHGLQITSARDELPPHFHGDAALLAQAPNLLVVSTGGAGYDTLDVEACTAAGVLAVNQAGGNREAVAEHVLGFMLALTKRIGETDRFMRRTANIPREDFKGHDLLGRTIGIVGLGHVGTRVAELCRGLFRMRVLACDPFLSAQECADRGAEATSLPDLLARSHVVSVNCPLTAATRGMIGAAEFALMRPDAYYINTARGFIHDEAALAEALAQRRIAGAGIDVWDREPPPPDHPLLRFDTVLASPHTAGVTVESRDTIARIAAEQMHAILGGARPPRLLNPEVWPAWRTRFRAIMGHDAQS